jgi:tetratricopeptide (TPR) repeat protein
LPALSPARQIRLDTGNHLALSNRSAAHAAVGAFDKALEDAQKVAAPPPTPEPGTTRARAPGLSGPSSLFFVLWMQVVQLAPDWAKGYSRLGAALHGGGQWAEAFQAYRAGLAIEPDNQVASPGCSSARGFGRSFAAPRDLPVLPPTAPARPAPHLTRAARQALRDGADTALRAVQARRRPRPRAVPAPAPPRAVPAPAPPRAPSGVSVRRAAASAAARGAGA